jgi:hypothetical protein
MLCRYLSRVDALPPLLLGPLFGRCFATESVLACFLADVLPPWSLGSLADALPPWFVGGCFAALVAQFVGGCFAAVVAWFVGGCFAAVAARCSLYGWMLCYHGLVSCVGNLCIGILLQA